MLYEASGLADSRSQKISVEKESDHQLSDISEKIKHADACDEHNDALVERESLQRIFHVLDVDAFDIVIENHDAQDAFYAAEKYISEYVRNF